MIDTQLGFRAVIVAGLLALCLPIVACGDSEEGTETEGAAAATAEKLSPSEERKAVIKAKKDLEDALYGAQVEKYCAGLTPAAALKLAGGKQSGKTCVQAVKVFVPRPLPPSVRATYRGRFVSVDVNGNKAALVSRGVDGGKDTSYFVKQDGQWKLSRDKIAPNKPPGSGG